MVCIASFWFFTVYRLNPDEPVGCLRSWKRALLAGHGTFYSALLTVFLGEIQFCVTGMLRWQVISMCFQSLQMTLQTWDELSHSKKRLLILTLEDLMVERSVGKGLSHLLICVPSPSCRSDELTPRGTQPVALEVCKCSGQGDDCQPWPPCCLREGERPPPSAPEGKDSHNRGLLCLKEEKRANGSGCFLCAGSLHKTVCMVTFSSLG